jgi:hypothetical protein
LFPVEPGRHARVRARLKHLIAISFAFEHAPPGMRRRIPSWLRGPLEM